MIWGRNEHLFIYFLFSYIILCPRLNSSNSAHRHNVVPRSEDLELVENIFKVQSSVSP